MAGSRKEYELLFKLQASLGGNFNAAFKGAISTTRQLQNTMKKLNSTTGKIDAFKKQSTALESNRQKLAQLTAEHDRLQRELSQTEQPSEKLRAAMERNERQIADTTAKIEAQEARLRTLGDELSDAGVDTSRLAQENERLAKSYDRLKNGQEELARLNGAIQKNNEAISQTKAQLGGVIGTAAALGAALYAGPVKKAAEFEAQMSSVQAISGASAGDMAELTDLAKKMGATTQFTAVESGKALEYMAMAGWETKQMLDGLPGIMNLAAASGEDLGAVSDIVTDAITAFGMKADDAERFADVLAQASSNANTNVGMMGATFQKVAPVAGALGYSVEDMSLAIGLMANATVKADVAGTSLKTSLANMAKPTKQMKTYMDRYGISLTRSDGSMKTFRELVDNLRSSLGGLSQDEQVAAATAIFGKESFAGMLAIVNASDEDFQKLSDSINNARGSAEQMAAIKLDNLDGDITLLKSALDGLQIAIGDALLPTFRAGTQGITDFVTKLTQFINENPELIQQIVKITAGLLAFKAATLTGKLAFLELKGGVLSVQKGFTLLKTMFALASVNSRGFSGALKGVAKNVIGYFGGIGNAVGGVGRAFTGLFSGTKIGNLLSGIGGAAGGLFSKAFSGIDGLAGGAAGKVTSIFARAGSKIAAGPLGKIGGVVAKGFGKVTNLIAPLQKLGGAILGPFGGIAGKILPVVGVIGLIIAAVQIFRDHLDDIRNLIERVFGPAGVAVFDNIVGVITNIGDTIKGIFSDGNLASAREFINGIFGEQGVAVFDTFVSIMQTVGGVIGQFISFIDTSVKPVIEELFAFIVTTVLPQIAQTFVEWGPTITGVIQSIWEIFQTVATAVMGIIQALMPTIQGLIGTGLETIRTVVGGVLTAIQGLLNVFAGVFTGDWSRVWEGVKGIFSGVWEAIKGIAKGAMNGIIDIINGLIGGLNKLKIPDWVPGVGGKGINIPLIPKFAKGTPRTPDTFIAGEQGAELITNARNRTVFKAAETGQIFTNLAGMAKTLTGNGGFQQYRLANVGAEAPDVNPPTLSTADRQRSVVIHSAPVFHVGNDAQAQDIEEILRKHDEELLQEIEERDRQRADDERRRAYD
ncbi:phage tail tape measure protein [Oscillibacter sp. 1-3]|uniref:phage tail tape measure protein n=1 Tax=Oscillibacter sp. 1-3 TaxID=1235797 RepID=UPI000340154D|nr:phage tail tape measure protein [Oscillibacter sp. 1-3]EOS64580.1 phage tail tape measure protein, TP901 family, core region [Oscillibacter sp. 1-3]